MKISPPNYTQSPNICYDEIFKTLKEGELRVILVIIRQTFGWHKPADRISLSQLAEKSGMERKSVCRSLNSLIEKGLVIKNKFGDPGKERCYFSLAVENTDIKEKELDELMTEEEMALISNNSYQCPKDTPPVSKGHPPSVLKTPTKETNQKKSDLIEPQSGNLKILDFNGKEQTLTKEDLFSIAVRQKTDWTAQEIELLYERLAKHKGNVRDLASFCQAIIKKERIVQNINKHKTGEKPCRQSKVYQKTLESKETVSNERKESQITNLEVLDKDIGMRLFANWRETHKLRQPLTSG